MKREICPVCQEPLSDEDVAMRRDTHWDCELIYDGELRCLVAVEKQPVNGYCR